MPVSVVLVVWFAMESEIVDEGNKPLLHKRATFRYNRTIVYGVCATVEHHRAASGMRQPLEKGRCAPSNILTAVGKSLTRLAAFRAAVMTLGEGTRSYAKALLRFRCGSQSFLFLGLPEALPFQ
jgi:hypothetical protein